MYSYKRIGFGFLTVFWILGQIDAGVVRYRQERAADTGTDINFVQFFLGEHGLLANLLSGLDPNKKNVLPTGGALSDAAPLDPSPTRVPTIFDGLEVFFQKLMKTLDGRPQNPNSQNDLFADFDLTKLGLCSRQTCGDLYKFVDNLKSSPLYRNLKMLGVLLRDKEGLNLLGQVLTDPELLKSVFSGNTAAIGSTLLGLGGGSGPGLGTGPGAGSGNFSTNITHDKQKPEISSNLDGKTDYYYNAEFLENLTANRPTPSIFTGPTRGPIDYAAFYYDHDPKG